MSIEYLKELKESIIKNLVELKKLYPISEHILSSLDSLLSSNPCDIRIKLWFSAMQEIINEIGKHIEVIEKNDVK